jgi:hypothetical protein
MARGKRRSRRKPRLSPLQLILMDKGRIAALAAARKKARGD